MNIITQTLAILSQQMKRILYPILTHNVRYIGSVQIQSLRTVFVNIIDSFREFNVDLILYKNWSRTDQATYNYPIIIQIIWILYYIFQSCVLRLLAKSDLERVETATSAVRHARPTNKARSAARPKQKCDPYNADASWNIVRSTRASHKTY